ncbi:heat shock protein, putative [Entamoeba invadens IP1]|uniref:Heat shock protein, putative n=1 Tax=Entamoeba invadens IP1 TaxID=370355 RepID=A0A0A1TZ49_ENTIV|nr:heat shock protein, putative [Entamoeba invadens IP1]ELP86788.1 heat shock protein, putative [Entamoeba invadens IP1]|eukprot:XP_004253559.1 heat shock protein, putative [Entamoeba invadens IP1]
MKDGMFFAFDFGGGTLDTTVFEKKGKHIKFIGIHGNQHLGGLDIDNKFVEYVISKWEADFPTEMANLFIEQKKDTFGSKNMKRKRRRVLKQIVEKAKISLSTLNCVTVEYENYSLAVTRKDFEMCCSDLFNECMKTVKDTLNLPKVQAKPQQISKVVLVGGSSQIPKIRNMLTDYFGEGKVCCSENCYTVVANGACQCFRRSVFEYQNCDR